MLRGLSVCSVYTTGDLYLPFLYVCHHQGNRSQDKYVLYVTNTGLYLKVPTTLFLVGC